MSAVIDAQPSAPTVVPQHRPDFGEDQPAEELLRIMKNLPEGHPSAAALQERVMELYQPLIHKIARRYSGRGEPYEDLRQTGHLGLVKAIRGFDPDRGKKFISYLLPMVTGEIKRHFRDHTWAVRVPRRHQENRNQLNRIRGEFQQEHARPPKISELAEAMGLPEAEVLELVQVSESYNTLSLDVPDLGDDDGSTLEDRLGQEDASYDLVVERESLRPALTCLDSRERTILHLRFFGDCTQAQIAEEVGCSQMHVSRLLAATIEKLRQRIGEEVPSGSGRS
ncbi:SigB/SigF/SigG family RNA polymerase sigma factor [Nocardiopsis algeriensis]|uniref:RNA polymerase sigma-B factor n=1 Tax=Nocardiopsis algeriensis TaxID=1478215 RepID=A0A841IX84_9ACTN|nr:SigB/SigF/SigG family RNA polymerase sigma factor [Nocardiopsis algeriensis]MBB6121886.1 RNA polymerase sigma-B factor [Nocardiopsis algeriensis]